MKNVYASHFLSCAALHPSFRAAARVQAYRSHRVDDDPIATDGVSLAMLFRRVRRVHERSPIAQASVESRNSHLCDPAECTLQQTRVDVYYRTLQRWVHMLHGA
jgi:hypothetical protein